MMFMTAKVDLKKILIAFVIFNKEKYMLHQTKIPNCRCDGQSYRVVHLSQIHSKNVQVILWDLQIVALI